MNEEQEELQYIEDFMEFSKYISESMKSYLLSEGLITSYEDTILLTKKGSKLLHQNKSKFVLDNHTELEDYYPEEEFYSDDFDFLINIIKGDYND
jgi:hypothetical protein